MNGESMDERCPAWQRQPVEVQGRTFCLGDVAGGKLYHGTTARLTPGSVLEPGHARNFQESANDAVSVTSDVKRASHWAQEAGSDVHVYEVEPLGDVTVWRAGLTDFGKSIILWEGRIARAIIIAEFGT